MAIITSGTPENLLEISPTVEFLRGLKASSGKGSVRIAVDDAADLLGQVMTVIMPDGTAGLLADLLQLIRTESNTGITGVATYAALLALSPQPPTGTLVQVGNDPDPAKNGTYRKDPAGPNGWTKTTDRSAELQAEIDAAEAQIAAIQTIVNSLTSILKVNGGEAPFEFVDALGRVMMRLFSDASAEMPGGALIGPTKILVVEDNTYSSGFFTDGGIVQIGLRRDGDVEISGAKISYGETGEYALVITDERGIVLFGVKPDGSSSGGGGSGLTPEQIAEIEALIAEMEEGVALLYDLENTDSVVTTDLGPINSIPRAVRLMEEQGDALVADVQAQASAIIGPLSDVVIRGAYATATAYNARDLVTGPDGVVYLVVDNYTSSSITADVAAGHLTVWQGITTATYVGSTSVYDYAALRAYEGPVTRMVVRKPEFSGTFVVDEADSTTPDDGGGVIVDSSGRRWVRQVGLFDAVTWEMFGADRSGVTHTWTRTIAAHAFANARGYIVRQKRGTFLWLSGEAQVRGNCDLSGATVRTTNNSGLADPEWDTAPQIFRISGKDPIPLNSTELADFNANYKQYLFKGSQFLPYPKLYDYYGGMFYWNSDEVHMYRSGNTTNPRMRNYKTDAAMIGRDGSMSHRCIETLTTGSVIEAVIIPKEDSFLTFKAPKFRCEYPRAWVGIRIDRPMVNIDDIVDEYTAPQNDLESRRLMQPERVFSIRFRGGETMAHPAPAGSYALQIRNCVDIHVDHYRGLYGWGLMGNLLCKGFKLTNSHVNRLDFHWGGYDVTVENTTIVNHGARLIGGGTLYMRNIRYELNKNPNDTTIEPTNLAPAVVHFRNDYGCDWDGDVDIDGVTVFISPLATFDEPNTATATSFDVLRLGYPIAPNVQSDIHMPNVIRVRNVVFDFQGSDGIPGRLRWGAVRLVDAKATANVGYKTFLPTVIDVENVSATNVPDGSNAICTGFTCGNLVTNTDGARQALRPDGTNCDITVRNVRSVINTNTVQTNYSTVFIDGNPAAWTSDYISSTRKWVPRVVIEDCVPAMVEVKSKCAVEIRGGRVGRIDTGGMAAADVKVAVTGSDVMLMPTAAGGAPTLTDPALITFVGARFYNHANTSAAYNGVLRGASNVKYNSTAQYPNIPSTFWIP